MRQNVQVSHVSNPAESGRARATYSAAPAGVTRSDARRSLDTVGPPTALLFIGAAAAFELSVLFHGSHHAFMVGLVCLLVAVGSLLLAQVRGFRAVRAPGAYAEGDAARRQRGGGRARFDPGV